MTSNDDNGLLIEDYVLKRMVYVNSANHGYSELLLDNHLAMFGRNNSGKTASLAGTKLLLFPEVSFFKCEDKFKFEGKRGRYSMEESYEFYFPDMKSFMALEVENPEGTFCMILYKTNNYGYGRFFVPCPYSEVRHLFWNADSDTFAKDISIKSLNKFVKSSNGIQVTDSKEITYLMFDSFRDDRTKKRFCVLPLKDARPDSIKAFKNIYQLAFESGNTETEALPEALATLLEMGRSRGEERLDANLTQLAEEHSQLVSKQEWLQTLANAKPLFDRVKSDFDSVNHDLTKYSAQFKAIENAIIISKLDYLPKFEETQKQYNNMKVREENLDLEIGLKNGELAKANGAIELLEEALNKGGKKLEKVKQFVASYGAKPVREIIELLNEYFDDKENELKGYQKEDGIKILLESNIKELKYFQSKLKNLNDLIQDSESSVLYQMNDSESASVLLSLNKNMANVSTLLGEGQKNTMQAFTNLFGQDDNGYLTFLGKSILDTPMENFDTESLVVSWMKEKNEVEIELSAIERDIQKQRDALKYNDVEKLIADTKEEIKATSEDIEMVNGLGFLEKNNNYLEIDISKRKAEYTSAEIKLNQLITELSQVKGESNTLWMQLDLLNTQKQSIEQIDNYLSNSKIQCVPIKSEFEVLEPSLLTVEKAESLLKLASKSSRGLNSFNSQLRQLLSQVPHSDIDTHKEYINIHEYSQVVETYEHSFATLDYDLTQHLHEIRSHNQLVSNQLNELQEAKALITNFINEINKELNDKHVSNLSEIKLHLEMDKRFESLLVTLDKHDIQDDSLLDEQFYVSLAKFVEAYFNKKTRRLKMQDIIASITYHYTLEGTGEVVTKSQSGGTTSTITAFVLSVLLKRIKPPYVSLRMPVIVDEISTLDFKNTSATIKQIADHGFSIFCATPSFSGFISREVGRWIMIDRTKVSDPLVSECYMNILPKHVESFGENINEA